MNMMKKMLFSLGLISTLTPQLVLASTHVVADNNRQPSTASASVCCDASDSKAQDESSATERIPQNFQLIRSTPFWNKKTVPQKLLTHHSTKKGVYAQLSVMRGAVKYIGFKSEDDSTPVVEIVIKAGQFGISPPQHWHRVELLTDDTYFNVNFFADPAHAPQGEGIHQVVDTPARKG